MSVYQIGALGDSEDMLTDKEAKNAIYKDILKLARKYELHTTEIPRQLALFLTPWSVEDGTLTATSELKRHTIENKHIDTIRSLYEEGPYH